MNEWLQALAWIVPSAMSIVTLIVTLTIRVAIADMRADILESVHKNYEPREVAEAFRVGVNARLRRLETSAGYTPERRKDDSSR